ncbi:MAG: hypothetical protein GDA36_07740 [Rhodobacteraceae bacterium]|nr:hypothetical protein [Paracoccaceae bacterium]
MAFGRRHWGCVRWIAVGFGYFSLVVLGTLIGTRFSGLNWPASVNAPGAGVTTSALVSAITVGGYYGIYAVTSC